MTKDGMHDYGILVTGGGTGIGKACAANLAQSGASVTICGRTEENLVKAVDGIISETSSKTRIQYKICDVTNENQVRDVVEEAAEFGNGLDGVVANAGGGGGMAPYHLQDLDEFTRVLHLNVLGTMLCVKHSVPFLKESDKGSFVGMSSIASHLTHLWFGAYPAAKAGIEAIMRNAADEFGPANIRFNAIRPGFIATEIMEAIPKNSEVYESYITNTPLGDVGEPKDVAALARFLISSESRWITGQCINVDGGHSLRRGPQFTQFLANFSHDQLYGELPTDD
ncbi:MAG: short-chain dehydrogenase [Acidimicrobiaceae bacterium]|nr:SDR family oxidoreductase [Acidimicrobiales bacterium]MBC84916.1 short-chain dehydrogenase [Acidimicrobiaceae bacterium]|tara:strand:- start:918 stop:1763 length:846 start_codon:yes stop_codon:yes gene_type:complete